MNRRSFLQTAAAGMVWGGARVARAQDRPPNIVLILADDLGYGDIGCYGSRIKTPNIDQLAKEGSRIQQFYAASAVCSPSRAGLLTGRYPVRVGVPNVMFPWDTKGLSSAETSIAGMLRNVGYQTALIGKWHLGGKPGFQPNDNGFDEFYGLLYSHDMYPLRVLHNRDVAVDPVDLSTLTKQFTDQATSYIRSRTPDVPFFLYMAHTAPHIPLWPGKQFRRKSRLGLYGDTVMEMDWSVGEIMRALEESGFEDNTLVIFTSDNGPWYQGSAAPLRGRKGETYDGGLREPFIARWPGRIPADRICPGMATMLDILPTLANICSAPLPEKPLDGIDITTMLTGDADQIDHGLFLYFDLWQLQCARYGNWKLHISRYNSPPWIPPPPEGRLNLPLPKPELYDLDADPEEGYDVSSDNPDIVADIMARVNDALYGMPDQVRSAWQDTMRRKVEATEVGALPAAPPP